MEHDAKPDFWPQRAQWAVVRSDIIRAKNIPANRENYVDVQFLRVYRAIQPDILDGDEFDMIMVSTEENYDWSITVRSIDFELFADRKIAELYLKTILFDN